MGKEVKIGLSIIAVLLCVFGGVLFMRLRGGNETSTVAKKSSATEAKAKKQNGKEKGRTEKSKDKLPKLGGGSKPNLGGGPALGSTDAQEADPQFNAGDDEAKNGLDNAWSQPSEEGDDDETPSETEQPADRYGNRYAMDGGFNSASSGPRYGGNAADDNLPSEESSPVEDNVANEPALAPAERTAERGQPGDGYQLAEEEPAADENGAMNRAESDPFPTAANMTFPGREALPEQDASDAPLETAESEVQLAPIDEPGDAAVAERDAQGRQNPAGDDRNPPPASNYAPISARQPRARTAATRSLHAAADRPEAAFSSSNAEETTAIDGAYVVQANDSFATISKKLYGTEAYFQALHEYNRERFPNPDQLLLGDEIAAPDVAVLRKTFPQFCPKPRNAPAERRGGTMLLTSQPDAARGGRPYLVAEGDTLFDIAKRELGKASRWKEIYELNQDQLGEDFNYLSPGMELRLPGDRGPKPDPVADRSRSGRRVRR